MSIKVGIAGLGALGRIVYDALQNGLDGYDLVAISEINAIDTDVPNVSFEELADRCDLIIECLPPEAVDKLAELTLKRGKDLIMISSCALLLFPGILEHLKSSTGRIIVPSGALVGLDGVKALLSLGLRSASIASTKKPAGFKGAPHIVDNAVDLDAITEKTLLFKGNALDAAKGFPANVNVAATLSFAGLGPEKTQVEIWADPDINGNTHEITVAGQHSTITAKVENTPDPNNPKSSILAAHSVIAALKDRQNALVVL